MTIHNKVKQKNHGGRPVSNWLFNALQFWRIMKLIALLITTLLIQTSANDYSQNI
jgi:hypothetical protein